MSGPESKPKNYLELSGISSSELLSRLQVKEMIGLDRSGVLSPDANANKVLLAVDGKFNNWEMICYCVEVLGALALIAPFLEDSARRASQALYTAHYGFRLYDDEVSKLPFTIKHNEPQENSRPIPADPTNVDGGRTE